MQGVYLVRRKNCYSCWQQSNGISRGQKVGVGNLGDRQTVKWTGGRGREKKEEVEERQDADSALTTKVLSELPRYLTEAPKHERITRNSCSFGSSSQKPGSLCGSGAPLHCLSTSPGRALCHSPTSHSVTLPVPATSPILIPVDAVQKRLNSSYCYYKSMINSSDWRFLVPLTFGLRIVKEK